MRIFMAGGLGFVGKAVADRLAAHELIIPTRDLGKLKASGLKGEFPLFSDDLAALVRSVSPDVVVNLLGIIRETPGSAFGLVHVEYTRRLLAGAKAAGAKKFIQMSALGAAPDAASAYHRTKFEGEELVRASGLPYVIFRPSYITGPGQGLRAELRKLARLAPVFAAPSDALLAPVAAGTVADCFGRAAEDPAVKDETFELGGEEVISFRELLARELAAEGVRRPVIGLPRRLFYPLLPLFALFDPPPMTREQYLMTARPNVPSGRLRGVRDLLGRHA
ncbi:MAG: NAD(P)H-binding protein [Elusimicrobia bacterium]|nr:NAD(P)H-binding protein [Elusimicrobiota bacterium]